MHGGGAGRVRTSASARSYARIGNEATAPAPAPARSSKCALWGGIASQLAPILAFIGGFAAFVIMRGTTVSHPYLRIGPSADLFVAGVPIDGAAVYGIFVASIVVLTFFQTMGSWASSAVLTFNVYNATQKRVEDYRRVELLIAAALNTFAYVLMQIVRTLCFVSQIDIAIVAGVANIAASTVVAAMLTRNVEFRSAAAAESAAASAL